MFLFSNIEKRKMRRLKSQGGKITTFNQGKGYKIISKQIDVPVNIVWFANIREVNGSVADLPGWGAKRKNVNGVKRFQGNVKTDTS